jgi:anti-sigma regulatory factor (Ser/Thr protein kinase)
MDLDVAGTSRATTRREGPGTQMTRSGVRQSYLELSAMASAVPYARRHLRLVLGGWGLPDLADPAEQVVSELMTNAVEATYGLVGSRFCGRWSAGAPPVRLWLAADRQQVLVQVWDGSDRMPQPKDLDTGCEHGRGLWLVEALSEDWGAFRPAHASGKVTWAAVAKS